MSRHVDSYEGPIGYGPLVRLLYPAPAQRRACAIIAWWERRRPLYNLVVGACGVWTLGLHTLVHGPPPEPAVAVVAVGIMANIAYTLGPVVEVTTTCLWGRRVLPVGPLLFRQGVLFSVGLTLVLPVIILTLNAVAKTVGWLLVG